MRRRELSRRLVTIVQFFLSMSRQYDDQTECGVMPTFSYSLQKFNVAAVMDDDYEDDDDDDDDDNNNNNNNKVTVVCPLADSYVASAAREARSVAELAATKKEDKYSGLAAEYIFQPIAVEALGPINESASDFFTLLAKKISHHSGDERETAFFVPARFRASAAIQRRAAT